MNFKQPAFSMLLSLLLLFAVKATAQEKQGTQMKPGSPGMDMAMMQSPDHKLMMAYMQSMSAFASALNEQAMNTETLDRDAARATVAELRHNLDAMEALHDKHMQMMSADMKTKMQTMMQDMDKNRAMLKEHVAALETAVQAEKPDVMQVRTHATALVSQLEQMSNMHGGPKKSGMKM